MHCSISGYGGEGPFAGRPGYDFVMQAETGFMSITGEIAGEPMRLGVAFVDLAAGGNATQAILAALYGRERTGTGQAIDIALFDSALHFLANIASGYLNTGDNPDRFGNAHASIVPYQLFDTADGCIALAVGTDQQYRRLCCDVLGCAELWEDERFRSNALRTQHREVLIPRLQAAIGRAATAPLLSALRQHGIPGGAVRSVAEAFVSPEALAREAVVAAAHPRLGEVRMVRSPLRLSATPTVAPVAPPGLGQHTRAVLSGVLAYSAERIAELERAGRGGVRGRAAIVEHAIADAPESSLATAATRRRARSRGHAGGHRPSAATHSVGTDSTSIDRGLADAVPPFSPRSAPAPACRRGSRGCRRPCRRNRRVVLLRGSSPDAA